MTERTPHPDDELASAHLDGATTPEEAARVQSDPDLLARVEAMRAVRAAVALPDRPVDPERRDLAIAAALGALDDEDAVLSLSMARARRRRTIATRAAGIAVAAAVAAAFALPRLDADDHRTPDVLVSPKSGTEREADADNQVFGSDLAPDGAGDGGESSTAMEMAFPVLTIDQASDLGVAASLEELAARAAPAAAGTLALEPATPPADPTAANACLAALQSEELPTVLVAVAVLDGRDVVAVVVAEDDGSRRLEVAAVDGCERLPSTPL